MQGPFGGGIHTSRICCCCCSGSRSLAPLLLLRLSLDRSLAQLLLLLSPSLVLLLCSDLATLQLTESTFGSVNFQGLGGSPELRKNHPQRGRGLTGEVPHYLS